MPKIKPALVCKRIKFNSPSDQETFFEWINKIKSIKSFSRTDKELSLHICSNALPEKQLDDIIALFDRYTINRKQLAIFLNDDNKGWLFDKKKSSFYTKVYPSKKKQSINTNYLICKNVKFSSTFDADAFFEWAEKIKCIENVEGVHDTLCLDLVDRELDYDDMKDLIAFLVRYKVKMDQLEPFVNEKNKEAVEPWKKQIYGSKK